MSVTIYHNPRCSKSRQTLELLTGRGIKARVVEYLKAPPNCKELKQILTLLGMQPRNLMRRQEPIYKTLGLDDDSLSDRQLIQAMVEHPVLIERPIVLSNRRSCASMRPRHTVPPVHNKARIARPPEKVLEII